jgi:hypothetical protein
MNRLSIYLFMFFVIFNGINVVAQTNKKSKTTKKETSVNVFGQDEQDVSQNKNRSTHSSDNQMANMIKIDVAQMAMRNYLLSYERQINSRFGIEVVGGASSNFQSLMEWGEIIENEVNGYKFGPYFAGNFKYYTDSYLTPEGIYLGLGFRHSFSNYENVPLGLNGLIDSRSITEFIRLSLGYTSFIDKFTYEMALFGNMRQIRETGSQRINNMMTPYSNSVIKPNFGLNIKIGFNF